MRHASSIPAVLLLGFCAAAPAPDKPVQSPSAERPIQSYDSYKSWLVACDNTLSCVAKGFGEDGGRTEMTVTREAGPGGKLSADIGSDQAFGLGDLVIGDAAVTFGAGWKRASDADGTTVSTASLPALRALLGQIRDADAVALPGGNAIPLAGLTAALLRMDERQGRVGTETALLNPGRAPAAQVPAAPPVPHVPPRKVTAVLAQGEAGRLLAAVRRGSAGVLKDEQCDAAPEGMEAETHALDGGTALVLVPCIMGAYQGSSLGFLAGRADGAVRLLKLPAPYQGSDPEHGVVTDLTEAEFDPATGTLSMAAKGRGLADCGFSASWVWDGGQFRLAAMAFQDACGGLQPGDWPVLYRSVP